MFLYDLIEKCSYRDKYQKEHERCEDCSYGDCCPRVSGYNCSKKWVPDVLIFQYVFSDMYKHSDEKQIVQFIDKLASFLNSYNQEPIHILCNDINLSKSMGGGREFFDLLESKIQTPKAVRRMHFNNVNKERHYEYGEQYDSSELVFNMISDEIRNAYNPFESCASAQMLIKKERKK